MKPVRALRPRTVLAAGALAAATLLQTGAYASSGAVFIQTPCEKEWESVKFVKPQPPQQSQCKRIWRKEVMPTRGISWALPRKTRTNVLRG